MFLPIYCMSGCMQKLWQVNNLRVVLNMADVHNKEQRSYNMSRIKGKDTSL